MESLFAVQIETPEDKLLSELGQEATAQDVQIISALRFARRVYLKGEVEQATRICDFIVRWFAETNADEGDATLGLILLNAQFHLAEASYFGIGAKRDPASAVRSMGTLSNSPLLGSDYALELRVDREVLELDEVLGGEDILTSLLYTLGCANMDGIGAVKNEALGLAWLSRGVALGCPRSIGRIGMYHMGFDNPTLPVSQIKVRDLAKAKEMLSAAAEQGNEEAMTRLGLLLLRGGGKVELVASAYDHGDAVKWLRQAAHSGSFEAEALLALTYFKMKLYSKARQFSELAARRSQATMEASPTYASVAFWVVAKCAEIGVAGQDPTHEVDVDELYSISRQYDVDAYLRIVQTFASVSSRVTAVGPQVIKS